MRRRAPFIIAAAIFLAPMAVAAQTGAGPVNPDEMAGQLNAQEQLRVQQEQEKLQRDVAKQNEERLRAWEEENKRRLEEWKKAHPEAQ
ncbi:MAG: hypothetical protein WCF16_00730 [Alphaproteobacteria bacterium]